MKFFSYRSGDHAGLAVETSDGFRGLLDIASSYPGDLQTLIGRGEAALKLAADILGHGPVVQPSEVAIQPPISRPGKIICVGLNYSEHTAESGLKQPAFPTLFARFNSSVIGHAAPIVRPAVSEQLDYEGELVAVIGRRAKNVAESDALRFVVGYSIFNDASIRDYQVLSPQWTPGKNFDSTGAFGPFLVTSDALPEGCRGLTLKTRLNGEVVQEANIDDMVFSVAKIVSICSSFMTLEPGDVIVTGTPSGVGLARNPHLWMRDGDICEVEVTGIGTLSNPIRDELYPTAFVPHRSALANAS